MAWLRVSDSAGNNPIVLAPLLADPAKLPPMDTYVWTNAVFGFVVRCAGDAAGYGRSYYVSDATIASYGGPSWRAMADAAHKAGYWSPAGERGWLLVEDPENLLHIRRGEEIDWERQRKADTANGRLTAAVRFRDGDGCRYCPVIVVWGDRKSARGGTYDHRRPGEAAQSPDDLRVACRGCNGLRGDDPSADERVPALPPPAQPFYSAKSVVFLREHGYDVRESAPARPGTLPDTAPRDPGAASPEIPRQGDPDAIGITPAPPSDPPAGRTTPATALPSVDARSVDPANRRAPESRSPGRDGTRSVRVGSGRSGPGPRRARRGKGRRS